MSPYLTASLYNLNFFSLWSLVRQFHSYRRKEGSPPLLLFLSLLCKLFHSIFVVEDFTKKAAQSVGRLKITTDFKLAGNTGLCLHAQWDTRRGMSVSRASFTVHCCATLFHWLTEPSHLNKCVKSQCGLTCVITDWLESRHFKCCTCPKDESTLIRKGIRCPGCVYIGCVPFPFPCVCVLWSLLVKPFSKLILYAL